jgi:hypothetical protein
VIFLRPDTVAEYVMKSGKALLFAPLLS